MSPEMTVWVQYGAPGLLVLMFIGAGRLGLKVVDRWFKLADKIEAAFDSYAQDIRSIDSAADKRHMETRLYIETALKDTRHDIRSEVHAGIGHVASLVEREALAVREAVSHRRAMEDAVVSHRRKAEDTVLMQTRVTEDKAEPK